MRRHHLLHSVLFAFVILVASHSQCIYAQAPAQAQVQPKADPQTSIRAVLTAQVEAWNAGNIEAFMQGYAQSDSLRFASGANVQRGWKAALERYKKSYPNKAAMGTLTFSDLEITTLAPDAALVLGRWKLHREKDEPEGLFTLVFRYTASGWRILHDHTSAK